MHIQGVVYLGARIPGRFFSLHQLLPHSLGFVVRVLCGFWAALSRLSCMTFLLLGMSTHNIYYV